MGFGFVLGKIPDQGVIRELGKGFQRQATPYMMWGIVGILAVAGIVAFLIFRRYLSRMPAAEIGISLFEDLAAMHHLVPGEKRLLKRLADEYDLPNPAVCFVKVSFLLDVLERSALEGRRGRKRADRLTSVCRKVFGVVSRDELESMEV